MTPSLPLRSPCPPGACNCGRERLLDSPGADLRILRLTRPEEKRLLERLENLQSLADLEHMQRRIYEQLGIRLEIVPGHNEVRSMRGIAIHIDEQPGLCRKTARRCRRRSAAVWRNARRSPGACSMRSMTCCAMPEQAIGWTGRASSGAVDSRH